MGRWVDDIIEAFKNLNGISNYEELYQEVKKIRQEPLPISWQAVVRGIVERYSSDSEAYEGKENLFYSVEGLGNGVWGLREFHKSILYADDINPPAETLREETTIYRVIRDTQLSKNIKQLHNNRCQICGKTVELSDRTYSEAHHIKPLGEPHNGPDIAENIIVLCPNHHVQCDFGAIKLNLNSISNIRGHRIDEEFIRYHNETIYRGE